MRLTRYILLFSLLILGVFLEGCLTCVECNNCLSPENNVEELCYDEAKPYYRNRQEWRKDVKAYEKLHECDCK